MLLPKEFKVERSTLNVREAMWLEEQGRKPPRIKYRILVPRSAVECVRMRKQIIYLCLVSDALQLNKQPRHTCMLTRLRSELERSQFFPQESTRFRMWIILCCNDKPLENFGHHSNGSCASVAVTSSLVGILLFGLRLSSCCSLPTRQMQSIATLRWTPRRE